MTENELRAYLQSMIGYTDGTRVTAKSLANKLGFSQQYLGDVLSGHVRGRTAGEMVVEVFQAMLAARETV